MHRLGIDLGGTKIEGVVLDPTGGESFRERVPTEQEKGYDSILERIAELYRAMAERTGGCGGGLVIDGRVHSGRQGIAGEWGHMSIDPNGPACYCGARGCIETFISGGGVERRFAAEHGERPSFPEILSRYRSGEEKSVEFMKEYFLRFGRALANLIDVLDPDRQAPPGRFRRCDGCGALRGLARGPNARRGRGD